MRHGSPASLPTSPRISPATPLRPEPGRMGSVIVLGQPSIKGEDVLDGCGVILVSEVFAIGGEVLGAKLLRGTTETAFLR